MGKIRLGTAGVLTVVLVLAFISIGQGRNMGIGEPAPALNIAEWVKGEPLPEDVSEREGVTVVEFWATWCPPCRESIPHLSQLQDKYAERGVAFVGISAESLGKVRPFVEDMGEKMNYRVAVDQSRKTSNAYMGAFGVRGIPHAFVIGEKGHILWHGHPMAELELVLEQVMNDRYGVEDVADVQKAQERFDRYVSLIKDGKGNGEQANKVLEEGMALAEPAPWLYGRCAMEIIQAGEDQQLPETVTQAAVRLARRASESFGHQNTYHLLFWMEAAQMAGQTEEALKAARLALQQAEEPRLREYLESRIEEINHGS